LRSTIVLLIALVLDLLSRRQGEALESSICRFAQKGARLRGELGSPILVVVLDPSLESATLCNFTPKDFGFVVSTSLTNPLCLPF